MIYGRHEVGDVLVCAPNQTECGNHGTAALMVLESHDVTAAGQMLVIRDPLNRADVERLRDLCEEALA